MFRLQSRLITPITEGLGYSDFLLLLFIVMLIFLKSWHQSDTQLKGHMKRYWDMDSFGVEVHPPLLKGRNDLSISATLMLCVHWNNSVFGLSPPPPPPPKSIFPHFSASFVRPRKFNNTRSPSTLCLCLCLCSHWALSAQVDENDFSTVSIFFISSSAPTKCFSLPLSRPFWTQITFRFNFACFFMGGKGCCRTLIHTLNTTSIISLRTLRCTLIRAYFLFLMLFNSLPLMLFVGNFFFLFFFFF